MTDDAAESFGLGHSQAWPVNTTAESHMVRRGKRDCLW
jgi:hypothetical protein